VHAIDALEAGGSTNGGDAIQLAYRTAREHFRSGGVNRVILCTDGDFNVGVTSHSELTRMVEEEAKAGVFLTVLGFGMGNYKDSLLEKLADRGNGNYAYIDDAQEARKVLVQQFGATLVTIAKDVKIQVDFNPSRVGAYRLIGYENRLLEARDFHDDSKDAGEIGAGHTVTALYEIVPPEKCIAGQTDPSRYQAVSPSEAAGGDELLSLKLRYKDPQGESSRLLSFPVKHAQRALAETSPDYRFAAAVACFGMLLRDSMHAGNADFEIVLQLAETGLGKDREGHRAEFLELVNTAQRLAPAKQVARRPLGR
jgi:Ca-activated chloride channel family protein